MEFGKRIAYLRKTKGLTQESLADALGVSRQSVQKWESGVSSPPLELLLPLAQTLETTVERLLGQEQTESSEPPARIEQVTAPETPTRVERSEPQTVANQTEPQTVANQTEPQTVGKGDGIKRQNILIAVLSGLMLLYVLFVYRIIGLFEVCPDSPTGRSRDWLYAWVLWVITEVLLLQTVISIKLAKRNKFDCIQIVLAIISFVLSTVYWFLFGYRNAPGELRILTLDIPNSTVYGNFLWPTVALFSAVILFVLIKYLEKGRQNKLRAIVKYGGLTALLLMTLLFACEFTG